MSCCGPKIEATDGKRLLRNLRSLENMNINLNLNPIYNLDFLCDKGKWDLNFKLEESFFDENENKNELEKKKLYEEIKIIDNEIELLEKKYLSKVTKLLLLTQIHCKIKSEILDEFKKFSGIERDKILEEGVINNHNYEVKNEIIDDYNDENEKLIQENI